MLEEKIVLVNERNEPVGIAPKLATHSDDTPLHRGFSVFLFNSKGELLLQQRAKHKKTWPLVWSNSVCGHPKMNESSVEAAKRRLDYEIGITGAKIFEALPDYRYKARYLGVVENEFCPVLVAFSNRKPKINKDEVEAIRWTPWEDFVKEVEKTPESYSIWSVEETRLLSKDAKFKKLLKNHTHT